MKRTALITGASSGIGLELSRIFASTGHNLVLVARNQEALGQLKLELEQKHRVEVLIIIKDLSVYGSAAEVHDIVVKAGVQVDYLINNAGFGSFGPFDETSWKTVDQMVLLNIHTLTQLTHLFLPGMISRKHGRVLQLASTASFQPGPLMAVYFATKAFVLHFSEALDEELRGKGVTVTALCPGPTESGFQAVADILDSKLVKGRKLPSSKEVAEYGYKSLMQGKRIAIHGTMNRLLAFSTRLFPRRLVVTLTRKIQEK